MGTPAVVFPFRVGTEVDSQLLMDLLTFQNVFQCGVEERSFCFTSWGIETAKMGNEGGTALWPFRPLSPVCLIVTVRWSSSPSRLFS